MDLVYMNKTKTDVGILQDFSFDMAFGEDENNFELTVSNNNNVCAEDYYLYIENTEYGGLIDAIYVDTVAREITYKGRTWHGILNSKVIQPSSGDNYYVVSGDANTILGNLIVRLSLGSLFTASSSTSGFTLTNYQFKRYVLGYDGICDMLESVGAKLKIEFKNGSVELSAVAIHDYQNDELDSDHIGMKIEKTYNPINHLVCLGQGDLASRTVVHLYCDADGNISTTQSITGIDEVMAVFDYPNAESANDLTRDGTKKLKELNNTDSIDVDLDDEYEFDIGDIIHADDVVTGISVSRRIIKKIITINSNVVNINYKVGE